MNSNSRPDSIGASVCSSNNGAAGETNNNCNGASDFERVFIAGTMGANTISNGQGSAAPMNGGIGSMMMGDDAGPLKYNTVSSHHQAIGQQQHQHFQQQRALTPVSSGPWAASKVVAAGQTDHQGNTVLQPQQQQQQIPRQHDPHPPTPPASSAMAAMSSMNPSMTGTVPAIAGAGAATNNSLSSTSQGQSVIGSSSTLSPAVLKSLTLQPNAFHGKGSFPLNLTLMLESMESMSLSHIICWLPGGMSFVIHDPDQFLSGVLPKFFKSSKNTKIRSFYRKLNRWGFSILRNHHLTKQGVGTMRGVWNHPDFYRARAVECLKTAMKTGDTGCFLTVTHGKDEGELIVGGGGGLGDSMTSGCGVGGTASRSGLMGYGIEEGNIPPSEVLSTMVDDGRRLASSTNKKRRGSSPNNLRDSSTTQSTEMSGVGSSFLSYQNQRQSHRESDFSLDSTLEAGNRRQSSGAMEDDFSPYLQGHNHLAPAPGATSLAHHPATAGAYGATGSTNNVLGTYMNAAPQLSMQGMAASLMNNKRGRRSVNILSQSTTFAPSYRPVTQSGQGPGLGGNVNPRHGVSASWTAGSMFSQHDFNFPSPSFSLNPLQENMHAGHHQHQQSPLELGLGTSTNENIDVLGELASMAASGHQLMQPIPAFSSQGHLVQPQQGEGKPGDGLTLEDAELASFFEKFAESLQK